jgi:putative transcriptional regulator
MNRIKSIRDRLQVTQAELAAGLGRSQGNVAFYEKGQTMPPDVAKRLIVFARSKGHEVTFTDVYGPADGQPIDASSVSQPELLALAGQGVAHV